MKLTMQSASWLELTPDNEVIEHEDLLAEQESNLEAQLLDYKYYCGMEDNTDA